MCLIAFFIKADECGLIHSIAGRNINQRVSLFADDVAVFVSPDIVDLDNQGVIEDFWGCFWAAH
jgi:hypothetical protein